MGEDQEEVGRKRLLLERDDAQAWAQRCSNTGLIVWEASGWIRNGRCLYREGLLILWQSTKVVVQTACISGSESFLHRGWRCSGGSYPRYNLKKLTYEEKKAKLIERLNALNNAGDDEDEDETNDFHALRFRIFSQYLSCYTTTYDLLRELSTARDGMLGRFIGPEEWMAGTRRRLIVPSAAGTLKGLFRWRRAKRS
ncbi:hypothetical protein KSP40_PGU018208 [Platanthera guangdongensis]|uniref:Uncharacterized protein n=1 Tax=Platanthera guangdongensis TaxID=2320717 RepID=A0ABR2LHA9_9ASPA